jgi:hypothetical protein
MTTLVFGEDEDPHRVGDPDCDQGWCGSLGWPMPCEQPGCPGLVHANFGDESYDGYWLYTKCDVCGEPV